MRLDIQMLHSCIHSLLCTLYAVCTSCLVHTGRCLGGTSFHLICLIWHPPFVRECVCVCVFVCRLQLQLPGAPCASEIDSLKIYRTSRPTPHAAYLLLCASNTAAVAAAAASAAASRVLERLSSCSSDGKYATACLRTHFDYTSPAHSAVAHNDNQRRKRARLTYAHLLRVGQYHAVFIYHVYCIINIISAVRRGPGHRAEFNNNNHNNHTRAHELGIHPDPTNLCPPLLDPQSSRSSVIVSKNTSGADCSRKLDARLHSIANIYFIYRHPAAGSNADCYQHEPAWRAFTIL